MEGQQSPTGLASPQAPPPGGGGGGGGAQQRQLEELRQKAHSLEDDLTRAQITSSRAEAERRRLEGELERLQSERASLDGLRDSELSELRSALAASREESTRLKFTEKQLDQARGKNRELESKVSELTGAVQDSGDSKTTIRRLREEKSDLDAKYRESQATVEELTAAQAALKKQFAMLGEEARSLRSGQDEAQAAIEDAKRLEQRVHDLKQELEEAHRDLGSRREEGAENGGGEVAALRVEKVEILQKMQAAEQKCASLASQLARAEQVNKDEGTNAEAVDRLNALLTERDKERKRMQAQVDQAEDDRERMRQFAEGAGQERDAAKAESQRLMQADKAKEEAEKRVAELELELKQSQIKSQHSATSEASLNTEVEKLTKKIAELQVAKDKLHEAHVRLQEGAATELTQWRSKAVSVDTENQMLQKQIHTLKAQLVEAKAALDESSVLADRNWEGKLESLRQEKNDRVSGLERELEQQRLTSQQALAVMERKEKEAAALEQEVHALKARANASSESESSKDRQLREAMAQVEEVRRQAQVEVEQMKQRCGEELTNMRRLCEEEVDQAEQRLAMTERESQALEMQIKALKDHHHDRASARTNESRRTLFQNRPSWLDSPNPMSQRSASVLGTTSTANTSPTFATRAAPPPWGQPAFGASQGREASSAPSGMGPGGHDVLRPSEPSIVGGQASVRTSLTGSSLRPSLASIHQIAMNIVSTEDSALHRDLNGSEKGKALPPLAAADRPPPPIQEVPDLLRGIPATTLFDRR